MAFKHVVQHTGRGLALAAAVLATASLTAAPGTAYARDHGWHGHHHGLGTDGAIALGLGGALAGAAIANSYYGYSYPYYGGGYFSVLRLRVRLLDWSSRGAPAEAGAFLFCLSAIR